MTVSRGLRIRVCALGLALALAAPWIAGCTPNTFIVQGYKGPARPAETLSILRVNGAGGVQLLQVDAEAADVPVSSDSRLHIELLPGEHELIVLDRGANAGTVDSVSFLAEPGRVYRPGFAPVGAAHSAPEARVYEVDPSSDAIRRDVSKAEARTAAPVKPEPFTPAKVLAPPRSAPAPEPADAPPPAL